jgi:UDP-glucuronate 4-epimerase
MRVLVTGAVGFIGHHLVLSLLEDGVEVVGLDMLKPAYGDQLVDLRLKKIQKSKNYQNFTLIKADISKMNSLGILEDILPIDGIIHLAAYPGVRKGESTPTEYFQNNVISTAVIFEFAHKHQIDKILYASSSSVYGDLGLNGPVTEESAKPDDIKSVYGLTKWMNELQAEQFARNFGQKSIGLRFFTVFGSSGRPDMGYSIFAKAISGESSLPIFGDLDSKRDYTFINDLIDQIKQIFSALSIVDHQLSLDLSNKKHLILNLGLGNPKKLGDIIKAIEKTLEKRANLEFKKRPTNDAIATYADNRKMKNYFQLKAATDFQTAIDLTLKDDQAGWFNL